MDEKLDVVLAKVRGEALSVGSFSKVTLDDGVLLGDAQRLAVHDNHQWVNDHGRYTRVDINQAVDIRCWSGDESSRAFGPYANLSCIDGVAYVEQRIFAFYDEQQADWYVFDDGRHWKAIHISPASITTRA